MVNEIMYSFCRYMLNMMPVENPDDIKINHADFGVAAFRYCLEGDDSMSNIHVSAETAKKFSKQGETPYESARRIESTLHRLCTILATKLGVSCTPEFY